MPKIIKDLDGIIFESAFELFGELGYKNTDMKKIAKKSNIAVGTLYNYYSSKEKLFLDVFKKSWKMTIQKIKFLKSDPNLELKDKFRGFIRIICEDVHLRKGMGKDLAQNQVFENNEDQIKFIKEELYQILIEFIDEANKLGRFRLEPGMEIEFADTIFSYVINKISNKTVEIDKIVDYLECLFYGMFDF